MEVSVADLLSGPSVPLSPCLTLLLPAWALLYFRLKRKVAPYFESIETAGLLTPALFLLLHIGTITLIARVFESFGMGLVFGTLALGIEVALIPFSKAIRDTSSSFNTSALNRYAAAWTIPLIAPLLFFDFHDRVGTIGHFSTISQLLNDTFPPRFLSFPRQPYIYHYGIDVLAASLAATTRLRIDFVMSLLSLLSWVYTFLLSAKIGRDLWEEETGALTGSFVLISGGIPVYCKSLGFDVRHLFDVAETCIVNGYSTNPPIASYIFQPPFTAGIPLLLAGLLLKSKLSTKKSSYLVWGLYLAGLSLFQISVLVALAVVSAFQDIYQMVKNRQSLNRASLIVGYAMISILLSFTLGGFFNPRTDLMSNQFPLSLNTGGHARTISSSLIWNIVNFGLFGILGFFGLIGCIRSTRKCPSHSGQVQLIMGVAAFGLLMVNFAHYIHSWDIVKFATIASVCLALGVSPIIQSGLKRPLILASVLLFSLSSVLVYWAQFPVRIFWAYKSHSLFKSDYSYRSLDANERDLLDFIRRNSRSTDLTWSPPQLSLRLALWGGISTVSLDAFSSAAHGVNREAIAKRGESLRFPLQVNLLREQGVRYLIKVGTFPSLFISDGEKPLKFVRDFGQYQIYEI